VALDHVGFWGTGRYGIADGLNNRYRNCLSQLQGKTGERVNSHPMLSTIRRAWVALLIEPK
jgi:hypothetical protein